MGDETAVSLVWVKMGWIYSVLPIPAGLMFLISLKRLIDIVSIGEKPREEMMRRGVAHPRNNHRPHSHQRPIGFALSISTIILLIWKGTVSLSVVPLNLFSGASSFPLLAIPLFILAGGLMETSGFRSDWSILPIVSSVSSAAAWRWSRWWRR